LEKSEAMIKFKDVAHLYLGIEVMFDNKKWTINKIGAGLFRLIRRDEQNIGRWVECYYDDAKPLLRPLSDLKEEDTKEFDKDRKHDKLWFAWHDAILFCEGFSKFTPEQFTFLLKKGFDLFGLIESGEAIDKTKHK
jgi:hypothetical protein